MAVDTRRLVPRGRRVTSWLREPHGSQRTLALGASGWGQESWAPSPESDTMPDKACMIFRDDGVNFLADGVRGFRSRR